MNRALVAGVVDPLVMTLGSDKTRISLALALSLAYSFPVPANRQQNSEVFFATTYSSKLNRFISEFNERFLIETTTIGDGVRTVWNMRYQNVHLNGYSDLLSSCQRAHPIKEYLNTFSLDDETIDTVIAASCAINEKIETILESQEVKPV